MQNEQEKKDKEDKKRITKKTRSIDRSLEDSAKALDDLKAKFSEQPSKVPKPTLMVEDRLSSIQDDLPTISQKMLAYKLRRIADSKMLEEVSAFAKENQNLSVDSADDKPGRSSVVLEPSKSHARQNKTEKAKKNRNDPDYKSSTFQCKSDLDQCMFGASSAIDKALCYALFIRCAVKG